MVVDYSEPEISKRAAAVTDKMLSMLALHTYKTGIVAPMGRVYRSVLYPFDQGAMALMNLINQSCHTHLERDGLDFMQAATIRFQKVL